jgi:uncharacterized membrane protein YfbV (UPF0208 family)
MQVYKGGENYSTLHCVKIKGRFSDRFMPSIAVIHMKSGLTLALVNQVNS